MFSMMEDPLGVSVADSESRMATSNELASLASESSQLPDDEM
jgi:hypothetical protein